MASTSGRRVLSRRSHEKPTCKSDDPCCLVCDVNLALDGRTFTVVSSHQNSELCDVFYRVLAMTFTHDQAFVNVCNRCERQLKRLGRTTNIAMARQEGRKFRQQIEGNVAKHGLQGVVLGDFRNMKTTAPAVSSRSLKDDLSSTSGVFRRADTVEETSGNRKGREMYARSNSSVRVEEKEAGKRRAYSRDLSAPERKVPARELHSSAIESSDKNKEARRVNRSSFHATSAERTASFRPIPDNTKSAADRRSKSSIPNQQRSPTGKPSLSKMNSMDVPKKSGQLTTPRVTRETSKLDIGEAHGGRHKQAAHMDNDTNKDVGRENNGMHDSWELSSGELNPFTADIERENAHIDTARVVHEDTSEHTQHAFHEFHARDLSIMMDDDQFIQTERAVFMESSQSSQSSNEAEDNAEKSGTHANDESPQRNESEDAETSPNEDDNVSQTELTADDESKDRTKRVTFSENIGADASDKPFTAEVRPSPQAGQDIASDKGKLSKYESIDLDIDKSNPFFQEVFGEYNRRVAGSREVAGVSQVSKRGLQKTETILESDEEGDTHGSHVEGTDNKMLPNGWQSVIDSHSLDVGHSKQVETARTSQGHLADIQTRPGQDKVHQHSSPGDSQQDSSPLIPDTEDNRGEQKDVDEQEPGDEQPVHAEHEVRVTARGEGEDWQEEDHGLIEEDRLQQDKAAVVSETEDLVHLELTTSSSFLRHDPDSQSSLETPWLYSVSKVIQVTPLQPPVQLDDVDLKADEEQTLVKDISDSNSAQISLQPMQMEDTSATKSEASPLIDKDESKGDKSSLKGKDSKFKDQQPGLPCCTIL